jgi:D-sedoheptulose 7-phosphate isomerase
MTQEQASASLRDLVRDRIQRSIDAKKILLLDSNFQNLVAQVAMRIVQSLRAGGKVFFFGNGGSAADAQHLAAEFVGRYLKERSGLPALALTVNSSCVTAIGNDYGFERVFARQIEALGKEGDVAVGISTSGNSSNVVRALEAAKSKSIFTVALTGASGGTIKDVADCTIRIPSEETPRIQECHILTGHVICEIAELMLFGESKKELPEADLTCVSPRRHPAAK